jgi:hypothetical protein
MEPSGDPATHATLPAFTPAMDFAPPIPAKAAPLSSVSRPARGLEDPSLLLRLRDMLPRVPPAAQIRLQHMENDYAHDHARSNAARTV